VTLVRALGKTAVVVCVVTLLTTCTDSNVSGPTLPVSAAFDLTGLVRAGANIPIPLDSLRVQLRRADNTYAYNQAIWINAAAIRANVDTIAITLLIDLREVSETFTFYVGAEGSGITYYEVNGSVTVTANQNTRTPDLIPVYVGPGSQADSVTMTLSQAMVPGGDSVLATAQVWQGNAVVPNVPVGFASSDTLKLSQIRSSGIDVAWIHPPLTATDSVDIIAETPTGLTDMSRLSFAPPAGQLVLTSGDNQTVAAGAQAGAPLVVQVRDAAGNPYPLGYQVDFAVASGPAGTAVAPLTAVTDNQGYAQTILTAGGTAGGAQVTASAAGLSGSPVQFSATVTGGGAPGPADTVVIISGNNQTAGNGTALANPLVVEVRDQVGIPVPGVTVNWSPVQGSAVPTSSVTDAAGRAQTVWTLGTNQASQSLTASALTLTPATFNATATFATPSVLLSFTGVPGVGIGLSTTIQVALTSPAGAGGVVVTVTSDAPGTVSIGGGGTVSIPQNQSTGTIQINGLAVGNTTIRGNATGLTEGILTVDVQDRSISLPQTLNVPYGQTASLPIQLASPAPAGGVTFTISSDAPGFVGVQTPTVFIAAGALTGNAILQGVLPGPAIVTVSNVAYTTATSNVLSTASLNIVQGSAALNASFGTTISINFESNGTGIAAPSPGISVTLTPANPACVAAVSPVTIPTGLVNITSVLTYGGSATLPCSTMLVASAPNLQPDSINVTVNPIPGISLSGFNVTGAGLMDAGSLNLAASNHGGVTVTITSSDPGVVLVSPNSTTPGTATIQVFIPIGSSSLGYYIQGVEGTTGSATLTASATGFNNGTTTVTIVTPGIEFHGLPGTTTSLSADNNLYAQVGVPNGQLTGLSYVQNVRPGIAGGFMTATFVSDTPSVGVLTDTLGSGATKTARIIPGFYYSPTSVGAGGVGFHPLTNGINTVRVSTPGLIQMTGTGVRTITVTQPAITISGLNPTGSGLMDAGSISLGASQHGGVTVTVTSSNPGVVLVSPNSTTPGVDSFDIFVANGTSSASYYIQGVEGQTGTATITASSPAFSNGTTTATIVTPGIEFHGLPGSTTTLSADNNIYAQVGVPNGQLTGLSYVQNVRPGIAGGFITVTFVSDTPSVGVLADSTGTAATRTARIIPGFYYSPTSVSGGGVAFHPLATGVSTVNASAPGFIQMTTTNFRAITVVQPGISMSGLNPTGAGLMDAGSVSLGASQHGGVTVTITSSNPGVVLVSPNSTTPGSDSIDVFVANGATAIGYYIQGVEGQAGTSTITAKSPLFNQGTSTATVVTPGVEFHGLPGTTTTLSANNNLYAQVGVPNGPGSSLSYVQNVRPGITGGFLTATFTSNPATVGTLIDTLGTGPTKTARIIPGFYYSPTTVGAGGVGFHPILAGNGQVTVDIPGFTRMTSTGQRSVVVTQPGMTLSGVSPTGAGLMDAASLSLGAGNHGGVNVTIFSSNPGVALVSPNFTTPGTDTIVVFVPNGTTTITYYVQGVEGQTGTVTITGQASGFTNGTTTATIVQGGVEIQNVPTSIAVGAQPVAFYAQVGVANGTNSNLAYVQYVRPGIAGGGLTATMNSSVPSVGTLFTQAAGAGTPRTAVIPSGLYYSPTSITPTGGIGFQPVAPGSTTVTVDVPGFLRMTVFGNRSVTVN
jgi:hypothetical protein